MKLIIINGPVGVGKTTLGQKLQAILPLSFFIHFDELRRHIGEYREQPHKSRILTFDLAFAIAETCFKQGKDILIDKIMYDTIEEGQEKTSLNQMIEIANQHGADVHEFIIWANKETILKRLNERGYRKNSLLTPEKAEAFWEEMNHFKDKRKEAILVDTSKMSPEEVFEKVKSVLNV